MAVTLNLIAVPNGLTSTGALAVSLVVAPRLTNGRRLGQFPDMVDWAGMLAGSRIDLALRFGGTVVPASVDTTPLRPDVWSALFNARTPVTPFTFDDASKSVVVSYSTSDAIAAVKEPYMTAIATSPNALPTADESGHRLLPLALPRGDELTNLLTRHRLRRWRQQQDGQTRQTMFARRPDEVGLDFMLFSRMPQPGPGAPDPVPRTAAALDELLDFHAAVTALSAHPALMRALGLILDATVDPATVKAAGVLGMPVATLSVEKFATRRGFRDVAEITPGVLYRYSPAAAGVVPLFATADTVPGAIAEGYLGLDPRLFQLVDLDVDGALAKLTNLAVMLPRAATPTSDGALPALRSAGLSLTVNDRGTETVQALRRAADLNATLTATAVGPATPLAASDLVRGYRLDVWSSHSQRWRSLHQRQATYAFGAAGTPKVEVEEEGFSQFAAASPAPDPTRPVAPNGPPIETDLYVHEALARWTGWSLSAPRPERAIHRTDAHDPLKDDDSSDALNTAFHMRQTAMPVPGTLPALRFGHRYRMRVRVVDIAGNSPAPNELDLAPVAASGHAVALPAEAQTYYRYEPIPHPQLVLSAPPEDALPSLDRLVIRSFNAHPGLDTIATTDVEERHVAPPRAVADLAERHGMLDDANGRVKGDAATFASIVARSDAAFATESLGTPPKEMPIERGDRVPVDYLPDPLARAAAFRFLPGVARGRVAFAGAGGLVDRRIDATGDAGPVVQVHFGSTWPDRQGFRLRIAEGAAPPQWDENMRVLTAFVPKSTDTEVRLSSAPADADLTLMGVWAWQREFLDRKGQEIVAASGSDLAGQLDAHARLSGLLARLALEGGQWALTPSIPVHVIHAVQQPIGLPVFLGGAAAPALVPIRGSLLRPGRRTTDPRAALIAMRARGAPEATLVGGLDLHLGSTGRVDLIASWNDIADDRTSPAGFTLTPAEAALEPIRLDRATGRIPAQGSVPRDVAAIAGDHHLAFLPEGFAGSALVPAAAPIQQFGDPRHRRVTYRAVATSRFEGDFRADQGLTFTRSSEPIVVSVPNAAPPPAPAIVQVLPTFGWRRERTSTVTSSVRQGRGIRVYLQRPWFASGEGELLGVVLWRRGDPPPDAATRRDKLAGLVTEWGLDPVRRSGRLSAMPALADLTDATVTMESVKVAEAGITADVAGHPVHADGDLWYADITFAAEDAYMPFLRLALVRFQPDSIAGAEISAVASAGFIQITPDRTVALIANPALPRVYRLLVCGVAPIPNALAPWKNTIEVTVEERREDVRTDLGWRPVAAGIAKVTPVTRDTTAPAVLFSGLVEFAVPPVSGRYRLVIREFESWQIDPVDRGALFHGTTDGLTAAAAAAGVPAIGASRALVADGPAASNRETFVLTERAIDRFKDLITGPPAGRRLVYAEFLAVEPAPGSRDLSLDPAPGTAGTGVDDGGPGAEPGAEPGADLITPDPSGGVPPWPPFAGPPPGGFFQPAWAEQPDLRPLAAPAIVSGDVKLAQAMLNAAIGPVPRLAIDGLFGPLVDVAMRALRAAVGLAPSVGIDPEGWLALAIAAPFPVLEPGVGNPPMSGPPVLLVQRLLNTISGTDFLPEDGVYTTDTADRVSALQSASGLAQTGIVDQATWLELARLFDHFNGTGAERVELGFDRARSSGGGPALVLLDRRRIDDAVMPFTDRLDESWATRTGLWVELQDSLERPVFRLALGTLLSRAREVPAGPGGKIARPGVPDQTATLAFVVPVMGAARRLVVFGTLDTGDDGFASPILTIDPW